MLKEYAAEAPQPVQCEPFGASDRGFIGREPVNALTGTLDARINGIGVSSPTPSGSAGDENLRNGNAALPEQAGGWNAKLALSFRRRSDRTVLAERRHEGPLIVQKPHYPEGEGVCHAILVHAPGGIAGGDHLSLDLDVGHGSHALVTTPAATKWYKSGGRGARQDLAASIGDGAILEWLPQESIVFDSAEAGMVADIRLTGRAVYAGWEILCLGRRASGEQFRTGAIRQRMAIRRDDRLLWNESLCLAGGDRLLASPMAFKGRHVFGGMVVAGGAVSDALMDACRGVRADQGEGGVTLCGEVFSARYLGDSAAAAKDYFETLRAVLRPWYAGRAAERPRIWTM